jgi:serpin B
MRSYAGCRRGLVVVIAASLGGFAVGAGGVTDTATSATPATSATATTPPGNGGATARGGDAAAGGNGTARAAAEPPKATLRRRGAPARETPAEAGAAFGLDLMRGLGGGNVVFSPDSVESALAMAGTGAVGPTADQMARVLHLGSPAAFAAVGRLQSAIAAEQAAAATGEKQAPPTLNIANGLFVQQGFPLRAPFAAGLRGNFGASPQSVDFKSDSSGAVEAVNAWVDTHTNGLIPRMLDSLSPETRLALANAVYLKAAWLDPFKARDTAPAPFHSEHGVKTVPFMHETQGLRYARGRGYAAAELPYASSTLSLLVVLPAGESVAALQKRLSAGELARIAETLAPRSVALSIPKFRLEFKAELKGPLQALGMTNPFSDAADFSRIAASEGLKLGVVDHAAYFSIDEEGTLAAAATVVTMEPTAIERPSPRTVRFDADRPFLFFLRDDRTGAVLFAGRLADPAAAPPA